MRRPKYRDTTQLYEKLGELVNKYAIHHVGSTVPWRSKKLDAIEAILHELAHGVCLGDPMLCRDINGHLPSDVEGRDAQELKTLRVERRAFELLGRPLTRRKALALFGAAIFDGHVPEQERFEAPLTAEEEKLAAEIVRLIEDA